MSFQRLVTYYSHFFILLKSPPPQALTQLRVCILTSTMISNHKVDECPILYPLEVEFADPIAYLLRPNIMELGREYGLVKVVPPLLFKPKFTLSPEFRFHTRLQRILDLGLLNRLRDFFRTLLNRYLSMRGKRRVGPLFREPSHPDGRIYYYDLYVAVTNMGGFDAMKPSDWTTVLRQLGVTNKDLNICYKTYVNYLLDYAEYLENVKDYQFPDSDSEDDGDLCIKCGEAEDDNGIQCDDCDAIYHLECVEPPLDSVPEGTWYCPKCLVGTGEYGFEEKLVQYSLHEFAKKCGEFDAKFFNDHFGGQYPSVTEIERLFWKLVDEEYLELEVEYGADIHRMKPGQILGFPREDTPGVDMNDRTTSYYVNHPFNLNKLPYAAGSLLNFVPNEILGMTIPWIYVGLLLLTFCWHVEDHYTLLANYCHFGATKRWYGIPLNYADRFEEYMKNMAPDMFKKQPDLLHQLVTLVNPETLVKAGIPCCYADQRPGEYVITYPRVYHAGFNCGFNFNEAVNFNMKCWLPSGEQAINLYRLIKKENVFNHYQLLLNVLKEFNRRVRVFEDTLKIDRDLVNQCLQQFKRFSAKQDALIRELDMTKFTTSYRPRTKDEEVLCDCCKTHVGFHYIKIEHVYLFQRNAQLMTPDSLPSNALALVNIVPKVPLDPQVKQEPSAKKRKVLMMDEFEQLVQTAAEEAKLKEEKENAPGSGRKLRRTTTAARSAEPTPPAQPRKLRINRPLGKVAQELVRMGMGRTENININGSKKLPGTALIIRLCLDCLRREVQLKDETAQLVYEVHPLQLQVVIREAEANLESPLLTLR